MYPPQRVTAKGRDSAQTCWIRETTNQFAILPTITLNFRGSRKAVYGYWKNLVRQRTIIRVVSWLLC